MKPSNQKLSSKVNSDALSPESTFSKRRKRHPDDSSHHTVAMVIIYRSLGHLLPENYDPDRRSLRWALNLFVNCAALLWACRGVRAAFIWTKCHLCCSSHCSAVPCPPLAPCRSPTATVEPTGLGNTAMWKADSAITSLSELKLLFAEPTKSVLCILKFSSFLWFFSFCRLPNRPIINTPVVSTAIHSDRELPPNLVEKPIIVEYAMLETEERTKPVCVFWNHSITYVSAFSKAVQGNCLGSREVLARRIILEENLFHLVYSTGN